MPGRKTVYDDIGVGYPTTRRTDPRIAAMIYRALGDAASVVNVGAGTGSYEPEDRRVLAVEPSEVMIGQRPRGTAPAVAGSAEALPLDDASVDAAMASLTLHHWSDWRRGVAEMCRVARRRVVLFTWDPEGEGFWLTREYLPWLAAWDATRFPTLAELGGAPARRRRRGRADTARLHRRPARRVLGSPRGVPGSGRATRLLDVRARAGP